MGFFDLFKSQEEKAKLSHLKSLLAVAAADGVIEKTELAGIAAIVAREGISADDLERCIKHPEKIKPVMPKSDEEKVRYIQDMVGLMMIDGSIDANEMLVCKLTAEAFGYQSEIVDAIIADYLSQINRN